MADENQHHHESAAHVVDEAEVKDRGLFDFFGKKKDEAEEHKEAEEKKDHEDHVHHQQEDAALAAEFEKVKVEEEYHHPQVVHVEEVHKEEEKKEEEAEKKHGEGLFEKLTRSSSSSSSSSDEEEGDATTEGGKKKKKKKKGLKDKIKEKLHGNDHKDEDVPVIIDHQNETLKPTPPPAAVHVVDDTDVHIEKVEHHSASPTPQPEEKKGFLEKIKDKLPGGGAKKTQEATPGHLPEPAPPAAAVVPAEHPEEKKGFLGKIMDKIPGLHKSTETSTDQHHGGAAPTH